MFTRVVRFTDVEPDRMAQIEARIRESGGPPPDVPSAGLRVLYDAEQRTAVVLQEFATAEDMAKGAGVLSAMDSSETPGARASVDACEVRVEMPG